MIASRYHIASVVLAAAVLTPGTNLPAVAAAGDGWVTCRSATVSVALSAAQPRTSTVLGELCSTRAEQLDGTTVQLLVHGGSYNHTYWDFGRFDGEEYSYARHVAAAGFPTFAIDTIGAGASSKPPSAAVTISVAGFVVHQVVAALREGSVGGTRFGQVITVGHSLGTTTVWREAIDYHDVDGVISTGTVHHFAVTGSTALADNFYPAPLDPAFASSDLDSGYLTTRPGTRGASFYYAAGADLDVIAADEQRKDAFPSGVFDSFPMLFSTETRAIDVPVLQITGDHDLIYCGPDAQGQNFDCSSGAAIADQERPYYSPQAQLMACSVPESGHDIALHRAAWVQEAAAIAWSYRFVGQRGHFIRLPLPHACG